MHRPCAPVGTTRRRRVTNSANDAGFELYDLRVEVVGPADQTIYCGAKLGDYFEASMARC